MRSPLEYFGYEPGSDKMIIHWNDLVAYFRELAEESDRMLFVEDGPTTLGNPFIHLIISSPENLGKLEDYRRMSKLAADPRGLSQEAINQLCEQGKAVCVQSMSLHADEIGGTQMSPKLAWELVSSNSRKVREILDNVIFIMVPSFNPDGQIMVTEWYNKCKDTEFDGCPYPKIWHHYAGHSNNRDGIAENLVESRYLNQIVLRDWMPQAYQDHHHQGSRDARFFIVPYRDPVRPHCSPMIWRELSWYGAGMAVKLQEAGVRGVINNAIYPCRGHYGFHYMTNSHNIAGMLTESASCRIASPTYVHPEQLQKQDVTTNCPDPWPGGEWHLADIVRQQFVAAMGLLEMMAKNREQVLRNMVTKALGQTKAGSENPVQAFLIPPNQNDLSATEKFLRILRQQGVEYSSALEPIETADGYQPAGTVVVPLAQPKYGVVMTLLGRSDYPQNEFTRTADGAIHSYDMMTDCLAEYMGVRVVEANAPITVPCAEFTGFARKTLADGALSGRENDNFRVVNGLLAENKPVWRGEDGTFYTENAPADAKRIKNARIGVYQSRYGANVDEGYTRLLLEQFGFAYVTVEPSDIRKGILEQLDVLVIPDNYTTAVIRGTGMSVETIPHEYRDWLGDAEEEKIRTFVRQGGKLFTVNRSTDVAITQLDLRINNVTARIAKAQYKTGGSTLRVCYENTPYTLGQPKYGYVLNNDAPVMEITDVLHPENYRVDMRYGAEKLLRSGLLIGEEYLTGKPCMITAQYGEGEAILAAFSAIFRAQTDGTYKLLFNTLYLYE
ncbi:MAG: peptidase M14 family protein [Ruminococcaceae bacterium]|nr:peptidase M14 family protein [Oscillospiraceae bacterium]